MDKQQLLKQGGIVLAALVVILAIILLVTFVLGGSNRMLTSEELALEQTRVSLEIYIKQTEVAQTSTAGLYLSLGVPMPTETLFIVPTSGSLGQPTRTPTSALSSEGNVNITQSVISTAVSQPGTATPILQHTRTHTATLTPGQPTSTPTTTASPNSGTTQPSEWEGEWTAYFMNLGAQTQGYLDINVSGDAINATSSFDGGLILFTGTILSDGSHVEGTYTRQEGSGVFYWRLLNENELGGNLDEIFGICANKNNDSAPDPCLILDNR